MAGKASLKNGKQKKTVTSKATSAVKKASKPAPKLKSNKAAAPANNHRAKKAAPGFYVVVDRHQLQITTAKPAATARWEAAASFEAAKDKAVDLLISRIDALERHLWLLKQARDHKDYEARMAGE